MSSMDLLDFAKAEGLTAFAVQFGDFIQHRHLQFAGSDPAQAQLLQACSALLHHAMSQGHVCLDLQAPQFLQRNDTFIPIVLPPDLPQQLQSCCGNCLAMADDAALQTPLLLALHPSPRLYLHRYWQYERQLEARLLELANSSPDAIDSHALLSRLFSADELDSPQAHAVANALQSRLSIIAGGPGTGKTTVAIKVIAAQLLRDPSLRIALAAPTGKAAARMDESIRNNLSSIPADPGRIHHSLATLKGSTIHRLLGKQFGSPYFKHDRSNPLPFDLIIIDEASMIDLPLMAKLFDAVADSSRIVLLGDPHQLPSVEVGSIFGDIVHANALKPRITTLVQNFRAKDSPDIIALCSAINNPAVAMDAVLGLLRDPAKPLIQWHIPDPTAALDLLVNRAVSAYSTILDPILPAAQSHTASLQFRILTALRNGSYGMHTLNQRISSHLAARRELIIVTRNDAEVGLFNGDIGIMDRPADYSPMAWFPPARQLSELRIPPYEPAYAMTGHRAQGSEFEEVHIVLPADPNCPLLTRQWLYTAVSRARKSVTLWASAAALRRCASFSTQRNSGLFLPSA